MAYASLGGQVTRTRVVRSKQRNNQNNATYKREVILVINERRNTEWKQGGAAFKALCAAIFLHLPWFEESARLNNPFTDGASASYMLPSCPSCLLQSAAEAERPLQEETLFTASRIHQSFINVKAIFQDNTFALHHKYSFHENGILFNRLFGAIRARAAPR